MALSSKDIRPVMMASSVIALFPVKSQWGSSCMENDFFTIMCLSSVYFHSSED